MEKTLPVTVVCVCGFWHYYDNPPYFAAGLFNYLIRILELASILELDPEAQASISRKPTTVC